MNPRARLVSLSLSVALLLLLGCGTTTPAMREWEEADGTGGTACEDPAADACIVFACNGEEGLCGVFACEEVDPGAVIGASSAPRVEWVLGGAFRPPVHGPVFFRNWKNMGLRQDARPRTTFHFRYRFGYLPAFPRYTGRVVKHHLFPQAREFREWFREAGIDIHQYTMLIPEHIHRQIHGGAGRGGQWNAAWRAFMTANPRAPGSELMLRHTLELAFRYRLTGPIGPHNHQAVPIGPQLYQN